jgi:hypothetical protein
MNRAGDGDTGTTQKGGKRRRYGSCLDQDPNQGTSEEVRDMPHRRSGAPPAAAMPMAHGRAKGAGEDVHMGMPSIGALCQCGADKYLGRTSRGTRVEPQGREVVARGEGVENVCARRKRMAVETEGRAS